MQFPFVKCVMLNLTGSLPLFFSIHEKLRLVIASYLVDRDLHVHLKLEAAHVLKRVKLEIIDLPEPKC